MILVPSSAVLGQPIESHVVCSADSVVRISTGSGGGTGFFIDGWVLTNEHVIRDHSLVTVMTPQDTVVGYVETANAVVDLAAVLIPLDLPSLDLRYPKDLKLGAPLTMWGYPYFTNLLGGPSFSTGHFSALRHDDIGELVQMDMAVNPGNSGSPVFDRSCKVIGMTEQRIGQSIGLAISSETIHQFLSGLE